MTKITLLQEHNKEMREEFEENFDEYIDHNFVISNNNPIKIGKEQLLDFIETQNAQLIEKMEESIEEGFNEHKKKIIEQINNRGTLGVGDAVDVASKAMEIAKVEQGAENIKCFILNHIRKNDRP